RHGVAEAARQRDGAVVHVKAAEAHRTLGASSIREAGSTRASTAASRVETIHCASGAQARSASSHAAAPPGASPTSSESSKITDRSSPSTGGSEARTNALRSTNPSRERGTRPTDATANSGSPGAETPTSRALLPTSAENS